MLPLSSLLHLSLRPSLQLSLQLSLRLLLEPMQAIPEL
jgi:hypothetical protein